MGLTRAVLGSALTTVLAAVLLVVAPTPARAAPVLTAPPSVSGTAEFDRTLRADPGTWDPAEVTLAYQWLRAGEPVAGATGTAYRLGLDDLDRRIRVRVTATDAAGESATAVSEPTARVRRAEIVFVEQPRLRGVARYGHVLEVDPGRTRPRDVRRAVSWFVGGDRVRGEHGRRYRIRPGDVGQRVQALVLVKAPGHAHAVGRTARQLVDHRVGVRRTVTYSVQTRGRITTSLRTFRRQAQQTYADARGWRGAGVRFRPVAKGGSFTLVLAAAGEVPKFHPICSASWSCRVGRYVVINQERWKHASPAWNAANGALRDYRHMVVNHETGHWLGHGHASCPRRGALAPVMQQQSKSLGGCRFNPWPTLGELR